jgi:hypothetical protein
MNLWDEFVASNFILHNIQKKYLILAEFNSKNTAVSLSSRLCGEGVLLITEES